MTNRIADLRSPIADLDQAKATFQAIALGCKRLAVSQARYEKAKAELAKRFEDETSARRNGVAELTEDLGKFCAANPQLFKDPRTIKTELGEFGLRTATELLVSDESGLIEHLQNQGYNECFSVVKSVVKKAIQARLKAGEKLPFCAVNTGDTVVCKVSKTVLEEAVADLED
jgi:hypothetical protein